MCASVQELRSQHEGMLDAIKAVLEVSQPQVLAVVSASYSAACMIRRAINVEKSNKINEMVRKSKSDKSERSLHSERSDVRCGAGRGKIRGGASAKEEYELLGRSKAEQARVKEAEREEERAVQAAADAFEFLRAATHTLNVSLSQVRCVDFASYPLR